MFPLLENLRAHCLAQTHCIDEALNNWHTRPDNASAIVHIVTVKDNGMMSLDQMKPCRSPEGQVSASQKAKYFSSLELLRRSNGFCLSLFLLCRKAQR